MPVGLWHDAAARFRAAAPRTPACRVLCTHSQLTADSVMSAEHAMYATRRQRSRCEREPTARPPRTENEALLLAVMHACLTAYDKERACASAADPG